MQGLALACAYRSEWPCLILAPASMCLQWADELEKWLPWLLPADVNLVLVSVSTSYNIDTPPGKIHTVYM